VLALNTPNIHRNNRLVSPWFQVILIAVSLIIIGYSFYVRINSFRPQDPMPIIKIINPAAFKNFGGFASEVNVGLIINEFEVFDLVRNDFVFTGELWFSFVPGTISLATLEKFSFARSEILNQSKGRTRLVDDKMFVQYAIRVRMKSPLILKSFPLNSHRLYITLDHLYTSPSEILFSPSFQHFNINANSLMFGWRIIDRHVATGYVESILDPFDASKTISHPTALFFIDIIRGGIQYPLTLFLPLLLIFFVIMFSFSIKKSETRINLAVGGVTGILAYRFVIGSLSPQTGYFMLSDYLFFLFLMVSIFIFLINIIDIHYRPLEIKAKQFIVFAIYALVSAATLYLFLW
jgi:hypothetical protein